MSTHSESRSGRRSRRLGVVVGLGVFLYVSGPVALLGAEAAPSKVAIYAALPNLGTGEMMIVGNNFGSELPEVLLGGSALAVLAANPQEITAALPALAPGSYLLVVRRLRPTASGELVVTITGAVAPGGGDITAVEAGDGLMGGGTSGDVSLEVDLGRLDGEYARLATDNHLLGSQLVDGTLDVHGGMRVEESTFVEFDRPDANAFVASNFSDTGCNRAITGNTYSQCSAAITGGAFAPTGGTGGAFESRGDGGNGVYGSNTHATGEGSGVFGDVWSPNAVAGRFRNQAGGLILQGQGDTWPPVFSVEGDGTVNGTAFVDSSSLRFKTNVAELGDALATIERLRGVRFEWRSSGKSDIGFIAEEVAETLPELVAFDDEGPRGVNYSHLTALLVEALKEQQSEIRELQRRLEGR